MIVYGLLQQMRLRREMLLASPRRIDDEKPAPAAPVGETSEGSSGATRYFQLGVDRIDATDRVVP